MSCYILGKLPKSIILYFSDYESFEPFLNVKGLEWTGDDFTPHIMLLLTRDLNNNRKITFFSDSLVFGMDNLLESIDTITYDKVILESEKCCLGVQLYDFILGLDSYLSLRQIKEYYNKAYPVEYMSRYLIQDLFNTVNGDIFLETSFLLLIYYSSISREIMKRIKHHTQLFGESNWRSTIPMKEYVKIAYNNKYAIFRECVLVYNKYKEHISYWLDNFCYEHWIFDNLICELTTSVIDCYAVVGESKMIGIPDTHGLDLLFKDVEKYIVMNEASKLPNIYPILKSNAGIFLAVCDYNFTPSYLLEVIVYECMINGKVYYKRNKGEFTFYLSLKYLFTDSLNDFEIVESAFTDKLVPCIQYAFSQLILKYYSNIINVEDIVPQDIIVSFTYNEDNKIWDNENQISGRLSYIAKTN